MDSHNNVMLTADLLALILLSARSPVAALKTTTEIPISPAIEEAYAALNRLKLNGAYTISLIKLQTHPKFPGKMPASILPNPSNRS